MNLVYHVWLHEIELLLMHENFHSLATATLDAEVKSTLQVNPISAKFSTLLNNNKYLTKCNDYEKLAVKRLITIAS